jgi:hypothetical protein
MVSDGSCGHRPMIWRPSDMVSVVDRPIDELIVVCCASKSTVLCTYSHKKIKVGAAHFFQPLTK